MERLLSTLSKLQTHYHFKLDYQKVDQHTGGKWLIYGTKHCKDNLWQNLIVLFRLSLKYMISICTRICLFCLLWLWYHVLLGPCYPFTHMHQDCFTGTSVTILMASILFLTYQKNIIDEQIISRWHNVKDEYIFHFGNWCLSNKIEIHAFV